jgi:hypothetical protein
MGNVTVDREKFYERINDMSFGTEYISSSGDCLGTMMKNPTEIKENVKKIFDACIVMGSGGSFTNETNTTTK